MNWMWVWALDHGRRSVQRGDSGSDIEPSAASGQGPLRDAIIRCAVELWAEDSALKYFEDRKWHVKRVGPLKLGHDLHCMNDLGQELHVEVKGTQSQGEEESSASPGRRTVSPSVRLLLSPWMAVYADLRKHVHASSCLLTRGKDRFSSSMRGLEWETLMKVHAQVGGVVSSLQLNGRAIPRRAVDEREMRPGSSASTGGPSTSARSGPAVVHKVPPGVP
jgi:hypothetical protein